MTLIVIFLILLCLYLTHNLILAKDENNTLKEQNKVLREARERLERFNAKETIEQIINGRRY